MYPLVRKLRTAARLATERAVHEFCAERLRPRIFILGAQKAGTTSLDFYLNQHPKLVGAAGKEAGFFSRDAMHGRGQAWYARQFPGDRLLLPGKQLFEATNEAAIPKLAHALVSRETDLKYQKKYRTLWKA